MSTEYLPDRGKSPCGFDHADLREQAAEARRDLLDTIERMRWTHKAVEPDHACEYDIALRAVQRLIDSQTPSPAEERT